MPTRSNASAWFFLGFLVAGVLFSGFWVYGIEQYDPRWSKAMSFGASVQVVGTGAFIAAVGDFVGIRLFQVVFSAGQSALAGVVLCGLLFCLLVTVQALGLRAPADTQTYGLLLSLAVFLGGLASVPLGKKIFEKVVASGERG